VKTLLFGGSFDPPHAGHADLLRAAAERIRPERILVVPAFQAPLKGAPGAPAADRRKMARLGLVESLPARWRRRACVDSSELRSKRKVYTIETVRRLKRDGMELHCAIGSDSAASWPRWKERKSLESSCLWWTVARPGDWGRVPKHFSRLPGRMPAISSSQLRRDLAEGRDVSAQVRPAVLAYIEKKGLYGRGLLKNMAATLKPLRYEHSLNVGRLAGALARRWKSDEDRARLAGLIHDCGRALPVGKMPDYVLARRLKTPERRETIVRCPLLLHAYISEDLARRRFGVADAAVLSAVRKHTLGAASMSRLDRIVYVADACSQDRGYDEAPLLRELAFRDLEAAFTACVRLKLVHTLKSGSWLHPLTVTVWNNLATKR
jgi:nicotinate-nucleotide adenylyltransferase